MKLHVKLVSVALAIAMGTSLEAQTLDWGSEVFSDIVDSTGETLDNTFVFEIGAFLDGFVPDESNVGSWHANWRVFDQAAYNPDAGYFTSTVRMRDDGTSDSPYQTPGAPSFEGLGGYLWVRNADTPGEGTEWLLTRADTWVYPTALPGCCDNETAAQWSVSDLDSGDVPKWGNQGGVIGPGSYSTTGPHTLQTFTVVPEPSSVLLALCGGAVAMRRRRMRVS
jgi:hypothetical protein